MKINACAKINWDLHVLGKRPDGFHEVDTVMVRVGLSDELTFDPAADLSLTCSDPSLPCDASNLILKAAHQLARAAGVTKGARMHLQKRIPAGGGMGGGSADAAATLTALNHLWGLDWPHKRLAEQAATLGSDVAFFLCGGWCRCRGRGEIVERLPGLDALSPIRIWIIIPPYPVPTPHVYKALGARLLSDTTQMHRTLTEIEKTVRLEAGDLVNHKVCKVRPVNDLLLASQKTEPRLIELARHLEGLFPGRWQMSGSGAVHFVIPFTGMKLDDARSELRKHFHSALNVVETATHTSM